MKSNDKMSVKRIGLNKRVISVDVGGTNTKAAEIFQEKVVSIISERTPSKANKKEFAEFLFSIIENFSPKKSEAIYIGVPALVCGGVAFESPNIKALNNFKIKKIVSEKFNKEVFVSNDAKCFALGEKYFGSAKNYKNAVCITLGTGIGAGAIINNNIYFGENCGASEIGRIPYLNSELEDYCSIKFFINKGLTSKQFTNEKFKLKNKKIYSEFGKHIGVAVSIIINLYNPEAIIFGGGVSKDFDLFKKEMLKTAKKYSYNKSFLSIKIMVSKKKNSSLLGATMLEK